MPRVQTAPIPQPDSPTTQGNPAPDSPKNRELEALELVQSMLEKPRGEELDIKCSVHKVIVEPGKTLRDARYPWEFDCDYTDLQNLRPKLQAKGGGWYRVQVRNKLKLVTQYDLEISPPDSAPAAAPGDATSPFMKALLDRLDRADARVEMLLAERSKPAPVPTSSIKETIETIAAMQALWPKPPDPNIGLSLFEKGMAMAEKVLEMRAPAAQESGLLGIFREVISSPVIADLAQAATKALANPPPPQPAPVVMHRAPEPASLPSGGTAAPAAAIPSALTEAMAFLLAKATEGAEPRLFADWCMQAIPNVVLDHVMNQEDPVSYLQTLFPAVAAHRVWFDSLIDNLYEPEQAAPAPNGGGDAFPDHAA